MVQSLQTLRPGCQVRSKGGRAAEGHRPAWLGGGFAAVLGVRASAQRAELTSGDPPRLPAEDELPPPSLSLTSFRFPAHFLGAGLSLLTPSLSLSPLLFSPQSLLRWPGEDHGGGWALWPDTGRGIVIGVSESGLLQSGCSVALLDRPWVSSGGTGGV